MNPAPSDIFDQAKLFLQQQAELYGEDFWRIPKLPETPTPQIVKKSEPLPELVETVKTCQKCALHKTRKQAVFGSGDLKCRVMLIGEAPGQEEDLQGKPFVGAAGQLLDKILNAIQFSRNDVFITNVIKCRPPQNRDPQFDEINACLPYLWKQIELIQPKIILAMGRFAAQVVLAKNSLISQMRGQVHERKGIKIIVTYHPAALLRNPEWKRPTWEDVKMLKKTFDDLISEK